MLTPLILCTVMACILMICGACFQARAAPELVLECEGPRSASSTGWNGECSRNDGKGWNNPNDGKGAHSGNEVEARDPVRFDLYCDPIRCPPHGTTGSEFARCPPAGTGSGSGVHAHLVGNWRFEASGRACPRPLLFPGTLISPRMGKKERDRQEAAAQRIISLKVAPKNGFKTSIADEQFEDDLVGPQLATAKKPYRARRRLYEELVKEFGNSGSRDQALLFKCAIHSRLPGFRKLIDAAFTEASREFYHIN